MLIRLNVFALTVLCGILPSAVRAAPTSSSETVGYPAFVARSHVPDEFMVTVDLSQAPDVEAKIAEAIGMGKRDDTHGIQNSVKFDSTGVFHVRSHTRLQETLQELGISATVEPNYVHKYEPRFLNSSSGLEKRQTVSNNWARLRISESTGYIMPSKGGSGVKIYIMDTGVDAHTEFGSRLIQRGWTVQSGNFADLSGHGTHVAGTAGSTRFGAAPKATLVNVRIWRDTWTFSDSDFTNAVNWIIRDVAASYWPEGARAVVNMAFGGHGNPTTAQRNAMTALFNNRIFVVAAAGNEGYDACNNDIQNIPGVIVTGGTNINNFGYSEISFPSPSGTNFGSCVDIYAPAQDIYSTVKNNGFDYRSGTSGASAFVSGTLALAMSQGKSFATTGDALRYLTDSAAAARGRWPTHVATIQGAARPLLYNGRAFTCTSSSGCGLQLP